MSNSTDSLKKKVCVTVFLDELFEEVLDEEWRELKQVSEITESEVKIAEKPYKEPSRIDLDNDAKVNVSPNADIEQTQAQLRPRKHRRESKFSKNHCDSFKNELSKYGYGSCGKTGNECRRPVDSAVSDSDFDLDEFLELDNWAVRNSKSSFSELSEIDMTEESFLSINPVPSSMMICCSRDKKSIASIKINVLACHKSTQFDGVDFEGEKTDGEKIGDEAHFDKEKESGTEDVLAWKKTQKQIHLILTKVKSKHLEKDAGERNRMRHYDLRSILEECLKTEGSITSKNAFANFEDVLLDPSTDFNESEAHELSDSYTCVFPHNKRRGKARAPKVKRVWVSTKRSVWNDGFESDLSEADCTHHTKRIGLRSFQKDSLLCYTLGLKCEESVYEKAGREEKSNPNTLQSVPNSESVSRESSFESIKSKGSQETNLVFKAVAHLANKTTLTTNLRKEQDKKDEETRNEGELPMKGNYNNPAAAEERNKNFADGDTFEKPLSPDSKFIFDIEAKEKLFVCDRILKHGSEPKVIHNEIIVNRAEIELDSQEKETKKAEVVNGSGQPLASSEGVAEVFFKQKNCENLEKNMTDAESEMIFAESENFCDNDDFPCDTFSDSVEPLQVPSKSPENDVCVVEFEDKLSRSKILRRMKTVEILGDHSLSDMKNISTEVILICENISNNEVCLEAWQSSASTLRSLTEMGQCYLKDSKDSAMYLIEIPLHFIRAGKRKQEDEQFVKTSDSD